MHPPDIFISYAREDEAWVRPLVAELERRGWSVFWDRRIPVGKNWRSHIGVRLESARCVIVVWSEHAALSKFVLQEADVAMEREVLLPVLKQSIRPPLGFRETHAADLSAWQPGVPSEPFEIFMGDLADVLGPAQPATSSIGGPIGASSPQATALIDVPAAEAQDGSAQKPLPLMPLAPPARDPLVVADWPLRSRAIDVPERPTRKTGWVTFAALLAAGVIGVGLHGLTPPSPRPTPAVEPVTPPLATKPAATPPTPPARLQPGQTFTDTLADGSQCPFCPEMVVIPAGSFTMGSPSTEADRKTDEGPQPEVTMTQPFALGRYEVTFAQWDACVAAAACNGYGPDDRGWGRGSQPVINVSWQDAQGFVTWVGEKTGQPYRLPTEAEWEYAVRAGTTTPFWTGSTISTAQANYDGNYTYGTGAKGIYRARTVAVDDPTFPANPFALYHMHGNVWEWVQDCYRNSYDGAPIDGSRSVEASDCPGRVLRGGSWILNPSFLRSASRGRLAPVDRYGYVGFRVARMLTP